MSPTGGTRAEATKTTCRTCERRRRRPTILSSNAAINLAPTKRASPATTGSKTRSVEAACA